MPDDHILLLDAVVLQALLNPFQLSASLSLDRLLDATAQTLVTGAMGVACKDSSPGYLSFTKAKRYISFCSVRLTLVMDRVLHLLLLPLCMLLMLRLPELF